MCANTDGGRKRKSVIVFIHGGGYVVGSPKKYHPDFVLAQDSIFVAMQYRLGIFGFLEGSISTGNMGLKDQQLALKWIYQNIERFSGNKDEILLMGQSSGKIKYDFVKK